MGWLNSIENLMSQLQRACKTLGGLALFVAFPALVFSQSTNSTNFYAVQGAEYAPVGVLAGDQMNPSISVNTSGGLMAWQDNITDGDGYGISAVWVDKNFTPKFSPFRVNVTGANDQENPQVALLANGGAAIVWQGGPQSFQHIFARFLSSSNVWINPTDVMVNGATNVYQSDPAVAVLANGNLIVTWSSYGQDNADGMQGVYAQILSPAGQKVGTEFQVNQTTPFNQRTPAIAAFPNGNFIVSWISELQRSSQAVDSQGLSSSGNNSVDVYARAFDSTGTALTTSMGSEFMINTASNVCANPAVAVASDNSFIVTWSQKDVAVANNSWDVFERQFSSAGTGGAVQLVNSQQFGDQFAPRISSLGTDYLVVWTSLGQDGSREGVFGQFLKGDGSRAGGEQQVNTTVLNQQEFPSVAADGVGKFFVAWSGFTKAQNSLDLYVQRYATTVQPLSAPSAPYVLAVAQNILSVSWPPVQGLDVSSYELFVDGSTTGVIVTNEMWSGTQFNPGSAHTFQLAYVLTDGRTSPLSVAATGKTFGFDNNFDGLPDDWQTLYFGANQKNWPGPQAVLAPGVTVLDVFLWGADPNNPNTWLKQWITQTSQGLFLNWNTVAGGIYQVQSTTDFKTWTNVGSPRFEAGTSDSIYLGQANKSYFKIVRNRY